MIGSYSVYTTSVSRKMNLTSGSHSTKISGKTISVNNSYQAQQKVRTNAGIDLVPDLGDNQFADLTERFIRNLEKKGISVSFNYIFDNLIANYVDDITGLLLETQISKKIIRHTSDIIKYIGSFLSSSVGCFFTNNSISVSSGTGGRTVFENIIIKLIKLDKNIANLITNSATNELKTIAENHAALLVKKGALSAKYESEYVNYLREDGFRALAEDTSNTGLKTYSITKAGMIANGLKSGVFYFLAAEVGSFLKGWYETDSLSGGLEKMLQDSKKNIAEATGATVGYIAGSAIGATLGGLIGGPAGAYLGQKIGAFVGQIVCAWAAGVLFEHWGDIKEWGITLSNNVKSILDRIWKGLFLVVT